MSSQNNLVWSLLIKWPTSDVNPGSDLAQFDAVIGSLDPKLGDSTIIEAGVHKALETLQSAVILQIRKRYSFYLQMLKIMGVMLRACKQRSSVLASDIEVRAVITNEGPHVDTLRSVLGNSNVQKTDESGIGSSFFAQAQEVVLANSVISQTKAVSPLYAYLFTGLFTGLVTAGIALSLLIFLNRYNKRRRILSGRELLTVLLSLGLGFAVGGLTQFLFSLEAVAKTLSIEGNFFQKHMIDFLIWSLIGLLLAASLAVFRVLPNLKIFNSLIYGLCRLLAGVLYSLSLELLADSTTGFLPALIGALVLGAAIGLSLNLLTETSAQFRFGSGFFTPVIRSIGITPLVLHRQRWVVVVIVMFMCTAIMSGSGNFGLMAQKSWLRISYQEALGRLALKKLLRTH